MTEERADAVGHLFGETVFETACAGFHEIIGHTEYIHQKTLGQAAAPYDRPRVTKPFLGQFDEAVSFGNVPGVHGPVDNFLCENMFAVLYIDELFGRRLFVPLLLLVQHGEDLIEKNSGTILAVFHASNRPDLS